MHLISKSSRRLLLLLSITALFSCTKSSQNTSTSFAGKWKGTYSGVIDNGIWEALVQQDGTVSGSIAGNASSQTVPITGFVGSTGQITMTAGTSSSIGAQFVGTLSSSNASGTWINASYSPARIGNWIGNKQ